MEKDGFQRKGAGVKGLVAPGRKSGPVWGLELCYFKVLCDCNQGESKKLFLHFGWRYRNSHREGASRKAGGLRAEE